MYHRLLYTFVKCYLDILCYCLTAVQTINASATVEFQNISCYCLTGLKKPQIYCNKYFKTSHVIV